MEPPKIHTEADGTTVIEALGKITSINPDGSVDVKFADGATLKLSKSGGADFSGLHPRRVDVRDLGALKSYEILPSENGGAEHVISFKSGAQATLFFKPDQNMLSATGQHIQLTYDDKEQVLGIGIETKK